MNRIIIWQPFGGLGDNLSYSTLPRLCAEKNIECYVSRENVYRNDNIKDFVWGYNPWVKYIDENPKKLLNYFHHAIPGKNAIEMVEYNHGLDINNHYPEIYYEPVYREEYKDVILYDFNSVTYNWADKLRDKNFVICNEGDVFQVRSQYSKYTSSLMADELKINNLELYSDILFSCKSIYTVHSGIEVLAAGIKNQYNKDLEINVLSPREFLPANRPGGYWFNNVRYITY